MILALRSLLALILATFLMAGVAHAQGADVALTVTLSGPGPLAPGADGAIVITLTNAGPAAASLIAVGTSYSMTAGLRTFWLYPTVGTPPCRMSFNEFFSPETGRVTVFVNIFSPPNIPAGSSIRCEIGVRVADEAPAQTIVEFGAFVAGAVDPNPANNSAFVVLRSQPISVPSGTLPSMLTLAALLLLSASLRSRHASRSS